MPIYEYKCLSCSHKFERLVANSRIPAPECPECGAATSKQFSAFAVSNNTSSSPCDSGCVSGQCPNLGGGCPGGSCPLG